MHQKTAASLVLTLLLSASAQAADVHDLDLSGIRLGIPVTEVEQGLGATGRGYEIAPLKSYNGFQGEIRLAPVEKPMTATEKKLAQFSKPKGEVVDQLIALAEEGDRVTFVGRSQLFAEGERPTVGSSMAALEEKYGKATTWNGSMGQWMYDRNGVLQDSETVCTRSGPSRMLVRRNVSTVQGGRTDPPHAEEIAESCGAVVTAWIFIPQDAPDKGKDTLVALLSVGVADHAAVFDAIKARNDAKRAADEAEAGQARKPSL